MTFRYPGRVLVLDAHLDRAARGLGERGIQAATLKDFDLPSTLDPDVVRAVANAMRDPWVLVTLDGTIVQDAEGFQWERYAIAWVVLEPQVRGIAAEREKLDIVARHAHRMLEQEAGGHFSFTRRQRQAGPPSLMRKNQR